MKIKFVKEDCWVGLFWKRYEFPEPRARLTIWYLCLVPCFPIVWSTWKFR